MLDAGDQPAAAAAARLGQVPDLVERRGRRIGFLAQQSGEADADDVAVVLFGHVDYVGVEFDHVGALFASALAVRLLQWLIDMAADPLGLLARIRGGK